jgi:hypothetical protein
MTVRGEHFGVFTASYGLSGSRQRGPLARNGPFGSAADALDYLDDERDILERRGRIDRIPAPRPCQHLAELRAARADFTDHPESRYDQLALAHLLESESRPFRLDEIDEIIAKGAQLGGR